MSNKLNWNRASYNNVKPKPNQDHSKRTHEFEAKRQKKCFTLGCTNKTSLYEDKCSVCESMEALMKKLKRSA